MISLNNDLLVGIGGERSCYRHPSDPKKCIKVVHTTSSRTKARIHRELYYLKKYRDLPLTAIPEYFGIVDTNLGKGYQFELILNYDGSVTEKLSEHVQKYGTNKVLHGKIIELYNAFRIAGAIVSDLHPGNIAFQKQQNNSSRLVIIDGFGNSDFIKLCDFLPYFAQQKLMRKFNRLLINLELPTIDAK